MIILGFTFHSCIRVLENDGKLTAATSLISILVVSLYSDGFFAGKKVATIESQTHKHRICNSGESPGFPSN